MSLSRLCVRVISLSISLQIAALGAVALGELVPDRFVVDEVQHAVDTGAVTETTTVVQRTGGVADHFGECVLLTIGVGSGRDESWFHTIATSPNLGPCPTLTEELEIHASGLPLKGRPKIRYWNGLSAVVRPALPIIGVNGLRTAAVLSLVAGVALLGWRVSRHTGAVAAAGLIGPLVAASDPIGLTEVFHHPLMLAIGFTGTAVLATVAGHDGDAESIATGAFVAGSLYSFANLMNFVPGLWLMTAAVVGACVPASHSLRTRAARMAWALGGWAGGYVSMWAGKWFWAALATSPSDVFDEISEQIEFRIDGSSEFATGDFGAGLRANLSFWLDQPLVPAVLVASGTVGVWAVVAAWRRRRVNLMIAATVASPCLLVVPWLLVTNNHNEIHYWFEYRSLPMLSGVVLMAALMAATGRFEPEFRYDSGSTTEPSAYRRHPVRSEGSTNEPAGSPDEGGS